MDEKGRKLWLKHCNSLVLHTKSVRASQPFHAQVIPTFSLTSVTDSPECLSVYSHWCGGLELMVAKHEHFILKSNPRRQSLLKNFTSWNHICTVRQGDGE